MARAERICRAHLYVRPSHLKRYRVRRNRYEIPIAYRIFCTYRRNRYAYRIFLASYCWILGKGHYQSLDPGELTYKAWGKGHYQWGLMSKKTIPAHEEILWNYGASYIYPTSD